MRRVWLSSFLLILVWPGSCGNAEASSVGPSCTATSATATVTVRLHEGSVPIAAATTVARAEAVRLVPALQDCQPACRPRARPEHRKTTRGETYMLQTTKEHCCLSTQPRPHGRARPQSGCPSLASRAQYVAPATLQPVALYYYKIYIAGSSHQCKKTLASGTVFVESSLSTLEDFPTLKLSP